VRVTVAKLLHFRATVGYLLHFSPKFGDKIGDGGVTDPVKWALHPDSSSGDRQKRIPSHTRRPTPTPRATVRELLYTPPLPHTIFSPYRNLITTLKDFT
jgi:hypothetical protein